MTDNNLWGEIQKDYLENKIGEEERKEYEEFFEMQNTQEFIKDQQGKYDTQNEGEMQQSYEDNVMYNALEKNLENEVELWKKDIENPEEICKQYELFIEMYFKTYNADSFTKDIEKMITTFLFEEKNSLFEDEEKFLEIFVMIRRIERKLSTYRTEGE